jgi:hypothetical protein
MPIYSRAKDISLAEALDYPLQPDENTHDWNAEEKAVVFKASKYVEEEIRFVDLGGHPYKVCHRGWLICYIRRSLTLIKLEKERQVVKLEERMFRIRQRGWLICFIPV